MMSKENYTKDMSRRRFIKGAGLAAGSAVFGAKAGSLGVSIECATEQRPWDYETDVICVGSGAAACSAAVTVRAQNADVILVEKMPILGGTTGKSGGVAWIPNNHLMREEGIEDKKEDCLRYMARYAYPQRYNAESAVLGLEERDYRLLEAFYDNGYKMIDFMEEQDALHFQLFKMWHVDKMEPDYADHLPENKAPRGRGLEPDVGAGTSKGGGSLALQLEQWLSKRGVPILDGHAVVEIIKADNRVIGLVADNGNKMVRIKARRGVVFGTGGYVHNKELISEHQPALYGACAAAGSTGDFIYLATKVGARMGAMYTAWRTQVLFEEAMQNRYLGLGAFVLPGDSMIVVNKYGKRVVNEKRCYNDRTRVHFNYDATNEEYPNQLLFMIFDERSIDAFAGAFPFPKDKRESPWLISGSNLKELTANIAANLEKFSHQSGGVTLKPEFAKELSATIGRFNRYAKAGKDAEFDRGLHDYDRDWQLLFSPRRKETSFPENNFPNTTMYPLSRKGPYYAFILAAGALDTNSGPLINEKAQVLDGDNQPIPGLYGAGNCIASPTRGAYLGGGGTIGLAMTFGYIAGLNVVKDVSG